jgi:hypothetical protein
VASGRPKAADPNPGLSAAGIEVEAPVLASPRVSSRRFRALVLLAAGWLLPAAFSAALLLHEIDHGHGSAVPRVAEALLHGHLHSDDEPGHRHAFADTARALVTARRAPVALPFATRAAKAVGPVASPRRALARRAEPDPGGPDRQATLSIFRI